MSAASRIEALLASLRSSIAALEAAGLEGIPAISNDPLRWAGVRHLSQLAIQACIDIADEVVGCEGLDEPSRSRDVFPLLSQAGLLPREVAQTLAELVDFRNMLAHAYLKVTPEVVEARLPKLLASARTFSGHITQWLHPA